MNENEAKERFEKQLKVECPECKAKIGELCDSNGVWIHLDRFKLADNDFVA